MASKIITDLSIQRDWVIRKGDDQPFTITFVDTNSAAFDISGYTFSVLIIDKASNETVITLSEGVEITNNGATGILDINPTDVQTATLNARKKYFWKLKVTYASTLIHTWIQGQAIVKDYEFDGAATTAETITIDPDGVNLTATISIAAADPLAVTSTNAITDNAVVRGDGGSRGIQESLVTIDDTGKIYLSNSSGPALLNEAALNTNAVIVPNRSNSNTGIGGTASSVSLIVNSTEGLIVDSSQDVTIPNGELTVSADTDATTILGRTRIDSRTTDLAYFSHYDMSANGQQALSQSSGGFVRVNAPTGQTLNFSINNIAQWQIDTNGNLDAQSNQDINLGSGSAIQVASIDTITFDASNNVTIPNGDLTVGSIDVLENIFIVAVGDESTALTTGTGKVTFRMPYAATLTDVRASVVTAPTGSALTVDINESGTTILSTKLSIDATEKTSTTAATAVVISDSSLADDAEITIDIDAVGSTVAGAGLKVAFYFKRV